MRPEIFYRELKKKGLGPFLGVPCSELSPFFEVMGHNKEETIITSDEGEAVGVASGLKMVGRDPVVFMQNSGLCNALDPLTSLSHVYKIPLLLLITMRGASGVIDAPQHRVIGQNTERILDVLGIRYRYLSNDLKRFDKDLSYLLSAMRKGSKCAALLIERGVLEKEKTTIHGGWICSGLDRRTAIAIIAKNLRKDCIVVSTTGKISREYYICKDKPKANFYMTGSMGCAGAIGFGVAMGSKKGRRVVVLDGDGALLMKLGSLATIGSFSPSNLVHIVLDNNCHESTGGQKTSSSTALLDRIARDCGYLNIFRVSGPALLERAVKRSLRIKGPSFILVKISKTKERDCGLPRPEEGLEEIKNKFMKELKGGIDV